MLYLARIYRRIILKLISRKTGWESDLNLLRKKSVAGSFECSKKTSGSIKVREFEWLNA
jgi:hypothetical protein